MRIVKQMLVIISVIAVLSVVIYAAHGAPAKKPAAGAEAAESTGDGSEAASEGGEIRLGGDFGKGTDPVMFDDETLVSAPTPEMTPDIAIEKQEKQAWVDIRNTRDLLKRCQTDLVRYEKFMRKEFMSNLNEMQKAITTLHTYAVLYKRDEAEYVWGNAAGKGEQTLAICEDHADEFNENYEQMIKNQNHVQKLLSMSKSDLKKVIKQLEIIKHENKNPEDLVKKQKALIAKSLPKTALKIQQPGEIFREWEENNRQMFWTKKKIDNFNALFLDYVAKYNRVIDEKDRKVEKLLEEHRELHKP